MSPVRSSSVVNVLCDPISFMPPPVPSTESSGRADIRCSAPASKDKSFELGT